MIRTTHIWARFALAFSASHSDGASRAASLCGWHPVRVRGSVVSLDGSKLVVRAKDGKDVSLSLADNLLRWTS
jgi:hypothetical protein